MKMSSLNGVVQFYIPEDAVRQFLEHRNEKRINDLDLNITVDIDILSRKHCAKIVNGDCEGNKSVVMTVKEI